MNLLVPARRALLALIPLSALAADPQTWVQRSNENSLALLKAQSELSPEGASYYGLPGFDDKITYLGLDSYERNQAMDTAQIESFKAKLAAETDPKVREDLNILIHACELDFEGTELDHRLLLNYTDVGQLIFQGEFLLLQDQIAPERRPAALVRLRKYTGLEPGTTPATELAKAQFNDSLKDPSRLGPYKGEVEQALSNSASYTTGIRKLFEKYGIKDGGPALDALDAQIRDYDGWVRATVLPHARDDFRRPPEIYAHELKERGIGISPQELIRKAELEFGEVQNELKAIAPRVAKEKGYADSDYRSVIRELRKDQIATADLETYYHGIIDKIEVIIRREHMIALPDRPLAMRLASEAETAALPAPHYQPPPLINNTGEHGEFILPLNNPAREGTKNEALDDFTFKAAAWTLTSHEGRPGHDLQFSSMVERGVSQARSIFAENSVNTEGWALYAEAEMKPFEPLDGQMIALQHRLMRAARAILDPMLNLGLITRQQAHELIVRDVCLSEGLAGEELDRYTFRAPGQAPSYFYGYSRLMELRTETEVTLGAKFDRYAFNNFIIGQGLLPPDLIQEAVRNEFVPSQLK
jgi:hypothetical protein